MEEGALVAGEVDPVFNAFDFFGVLPDPKLVVNGNSNAVAALADCNAFDAGE